MLGYNFGGSLKHEFGSPHPISRFSSKYLWCIKSQKTAPPQIHFDLYLHSGLRN